MDTLWMKSLGGRRKWSWLELAALRGNLPALPGSGRVHIYTVPASSRELLFSKSDTFQMQSKNSALECTFEGGKWNTFVCSLSVISKTKCYFQRICLWSIGGTLQGSPGQEQTAITYWIEREQSFLLKNKKLHHLEKLKSRVVIISVELKLG